MGDVVMEAEEAQADFLFLRQLGQGASSVRVSDPLSIENSESSVNLICISNSNGLIFAATDEGFIVHPLAEIRKLCSSSTRKESPRLDEPLQSVQTAAEPLLGAKVAFLRLADQEKRIVAGLSNGRIAVWNVTDLVAGNKQPSVVLQPPSPNLVLLEVAPNPSERPELCIALYNTPEPSRLRSGTAIALDLRTGQWGAELKSSNGSMTTSLCWSVKGKQVALGLADGTLAQVTPEGEQKDTVIKPDGIEGSPYVEQILWLGNHAFLVTYNQPPSSEESEHQYEVYSILRDNVKKQVSFVHFNDPAPPFGDTARRGHRYSSWLKGWEPTRHMVFTANTSSTDVGLLGCLSSGEGQAGWKNLDLEDTSRPVLPFSSIDKSADTSPVGLELDCTGEANVDDPQAASRGEDGEGKLGPMPVLYIYTTDGLLLAYTVINVDPSAGKYGGMSAATVPVPAAEATMSTDPPTATTAAVSPAAPATASPAAPTDKPVLSFGQPSGLGSFSSAPTFGQSASIGNKSASPFTSGWPFVSSNDSTKSAPVASTGGFGQFAQSQKPASTFGAGSTSFAFGNSSTGSLFGPSTLPSASTPGSTDSPAPAFPALGGSSGFGQSTTPGSNASPAPAPPTFGSSSGFGQSTSTDSSAAPAPAPSAFGSSSGFGQSTSASGSTASPAPAFPALGGSSGFGQSINPGSTASPAPPPSSFGSSSGFGQSTSTDSKAAPAPAPPAGNASPAPAPSAFGSSSGFGQSTIPPASTASPAPTPSAFGSSSGFGQSTAPASTASPAPAPSAFGSSSGFGQSPSAFGKSPAFGSSSAFGKPSAFGSAAASGQATSSAASATPSTFAPSKASLTPSLGGNAAKPTSFGSPLAGGAKDSGSTSFAFGKGSTGSGFGASTFPLASKSDSNASPAPTPPAFGGTSSGFGQRPSAFGKPSAFGSAASGQATSAAASNAPSAFASSTPSKPPSFGHFAAKTSFSFAPDGLDDDAQRGVSEDDEDSAKEDEDGVEEDEDSGEEGEEGVEEEEDSGVEGEDGEEEEEDGEGEEEEGEEGEEEGASVEEGEDGMNGVNGVEEGEDSVEEEEEVVEEGLQAIFRDTYLVMQRELEALATSVRNCSELQRSAGQQSDEALAVQDLSDDSKWTFGELDSLAKVTLELVQGAQEIDQESQSLKLRLKEIQSQQLKVDVKREEIARFVRARNDPSFGKMVRIKQLGPEHAENQIRLRRSSGAVREGIGELEACLEKMRAKVMDEKAGLKLDALRAPSLDTIRRTARNITQTAQVRLMELHELELAFDQLNHGKQVFRRSGSHVASSDNGALDSLSGIGNALPALGSHPISGSNGFSAASTIETKRRHLDLKSVFISSQREPVFNRGAKRDDKSVEEYRMSDLDIAFAKGTVQVGAGKKPDAGAPTLAPLWAGVQDDAEDDDDDDDDDDDEAEDGFEEEGLSDVDEEEEEDEDEEHA